MGMWLLVGCAGTAPADPFYLATETARAAPRAPVATASPHPPADTSPPAAAAAGEPRGQIVFTCQLFKVQSSDQICLMNADGSGYRRLTQDDDRRHFYPSLAPDGASVVYAAFTAPNQYDIFAHDLRTGQAEQLTDGLGVLTAPEISPDGSLIAFTRGDPYANTYAIWVMQRDGSQPRQVFGPPQGNGWDPTWSPTGERLLFASDMSGSVQLYTIALDGSDLQQQTQVTGLRGRSDWADNGWLTTYAGTAWQRNVFLFRAGGSDWQRVSPDGGNAQGPSFSPDGEWLAFTAYYDRYGDVHGCEIYILRRDGTDLRRLTNNAYCDWQPRWGVSPSAAGP